jgi:hypothetical protein
MTNPLIAITPSGVERLLKLDSQLNSGTRLDHSDFIDLLVLLEINAITEPLSEVLKIEDEIIEFAKGTKVVVSKGDVRASIRRLFEEGFITSA